MNARNLHLSMLRMIALAVIFITPTVFQTVFATGRPVVYVTSTANSGPGSLREAISLAEPEGTIRFNLPLPATIYITSELLINKSLTIAGPSTNDLWIAGNNACRIFNISSYLEVHLSNLNLINGKALYSGWGYYYGEGGGIFCGYNTSGSMENVRIANCQAAYGGGIYFDWSWGQNSWNLENVLIENNTANSDGGGIYGYTTALNLNGCVIRGNAAGNYGGGIYGSGIVTFDPDNRCSVYSNTAKIGFDLYGGSSEDIYLDQFTVIQPNDYFAYPMHQFSGFDINQGVLPMIDQDVYVSPAGSDGNSGTSPASPFLTISHALAMTFADPSSPNTIHLAAGTYMLTDNLPLYANSHVYLLGQSEDNTFIYASSGAFEINGDTDVRIGKLYFSPGNGYYAGIIMSNSEATFHDFQFSDGSAYVGFSCDNSTLNMTDGIISSINYGTVIQGSETSLDLTNIRFTVNESTLIYLYDGQATLDHCLLEFNGYLYEGNTADLIALYGNSFVTLKGTTIRENITDGAAIALYDDSYIYFDPYDRCNIYNNCLNRGHELMAGNYNGYVIQLVVDTFDVLHPNDYFVTPASRFGFDILHPLHAQVSQDMYVSPDGSDNNSGLTPDDPFKTITRACKYYYPEENDRDTIHLAAGIYETGENFPIFPAEGVAIKGAGAGATELYKHDYYSYAVLQINGHKDVTLRDLTINSYYGNGVEVNNGELILDHCTITSYANGIEMRGASRIAGDSAVIRNCRNIGISVAEGDVVLEGLVIRDNSYNGIYLHNSTLQGRDLSIMENGPGYGSGGGIRAQSSQVVILNSEISHNRGDNGGGISLYQSGGLLINNHIHHNESSQYGGGLYFNPYEPQNLTLINNIIECNLAQYGGGIYFSGRENQNQILTMTGTMIKNNKVTEKGGGLYVFQGTPFLIGSRIEGNQAAEGGGIYFDRCADQAPYLSGTTLAANRAFYGGGIGFNDDAHLKLSWDAVDRCNIYMNAAANQGQDLFARNAGTEVYSIVVDTFTVACPCTYFACSLCNFDFDILHGFGQPGNVDMYVSPEGDDQNSGLTPDDPMKTINLACYRMCLDTLPPHTIHLSPGVYAASSNGQQFPVDLWGLLEIKGQGAGVTILDGENTCRLFEKSDPGKDVLSQLTLFRGNAGTERGGAFYGESGGSVEFEDVVIDSCTAKYGGGLYAKLDTLRMSGVALTRNRAHYDGGATYVQNAFQELSGVTFSENKATRGGAMHVTVLSGVWEDVGFTGNIASNGGALCVTGKYIVNNRDVVFNRNSAGINGGAIYANVINGPLKNLYFIENQAKYGGAIKIMDSDAVLYNLCFDGNQADREGGAIYSVRSEITADHLTLANNDNTSGSSILYFSGKAVTLPSRIDLKNIIYWGNSDKKIKVNSVSMTINNCDIEGGLTAIDHKYSNVLWQHGNFSLDPKFERKGDHPLQLSSSSPCIDAAMAPIPAQKQYPFDLLGNERCIDGDGDGIAKEDMGAYEFEGLRTRAEEIRISGSVFRAYPDPVLHTATLELTLETESPVMIQIFDAKGMCISTIIETRLPEGTHRIEWDASELNPGMYFIRMSDGNHLKTIKCIKAR